MQQFTQLHVKISAPGPFILIAASVAFPKKPLWALWEAEKIRQYLSKMLTTNDHYNARDNNDGIVKNVSFNLLSVTGFLYQWSMCLTLKF
jgi:hypothetical protein